MNALCPREDELLDALGRGLVGPELESHVAGCASCSELRIVAGGLLDDRSSAMVEAPVPSAGTMWYRMQLRYRQETEATARRSLIIGQAVTLAVAIALVYTFFGTEFVVEAREVIASISASTPLMFAIATWIVAAPIAGWAAVRGK
jgi:hypothetical protein